VPQHWHTYDVTAYQAAQASLMAFATLVIESKEVFPNCTFYLHICQQPFLIHKQRQLLKLAVLAVV
jgi:hypothetical protein